MRRVLSAYVPMLVAVAAVEAATISGSISDSTGGALIDARVVLRDIATGQEQRVTTSGDGRYRFEAPAAGTVPVDRQPRGLLRGRAHDCHRPWRAEHRSRRSRSRSGRSTRRSRSPPRAAIAKQRHVPLHIETLTGGAIEQMNTVSSGDAMATAPNVTPVGNGPFGVRPRLRGLDSTRVLVLVDGERLNTARHGDRSDRRGGRPDLARRDRPDRDRQRCRHADVRIGCAGGHDQHHHARTLVHAEDRARLRLPRALSSNENGLRGTATLGLTAPRVTLSVEGGLERYDNYRPAISTSRTRAATSPPGRSIGRTRSTMPSGSRSARLPIRSTRRTCAPTTWSSTPRRTGTSSTPRRGSSSASAARCASATSGGACRTSASPISRSRTSSTPRRSRPATSTRCPRATRRRRSRRGSPISR